MRESLKKLFKFSPPPPVKHSDLESPCESGRSTSKNGGESESGRNDIDEEGRARERTAIIERADAIQKAEEETRDAAMEVGRIKAEIEAISAEAAASEAVEAATAARFTATFAKGIACLKHDKTGSAREHVVFLDPTSNSFSWKDADGNPRSTGNSLRLDSLKNVHITAADYIPEQKRDRTVSLTWEDQSLEMEMPTASEACDLVSNLMMLKSRITGENCVTAAANADPGLEQKLADAQAEVETKAGVVAALKVAPIMVPSESEARLSASSKAALEKKEAEELAVATADAIANAEAAVALMGDNLVTLEALKSSHPNNIAAKVFDRDYYEGLDSSSQAALLKCLQSGIQNADSGMGCYANQPADYDRFKPFFSKALAEYHGVAEDAKHVSDWTLPEGVSYDVATLGLRPLSMRTRVGRNLADFPLPGSMTKADRQAMENKMSEAFNVLIGMSEYGGQYYSITPGHPNFINEEKYQELVKAHIMFKDMAADSYLTSAGIAGDWPHGRGCYVSEDKGFIIWVGEEDHLRIMCMAKSTKIESVFNRLKVALDVVSGIPGLSFAFSEDYGNVTSCPTNLGTGMRSSVHIALPNLTQDGTDAKAKAICKPLGLSVRGLGGEHTPIGSDGTVDISPSARFCIKECDIVKRLYEGLKLLVEAECELGPSPAERAVESDLATLDALKSSHPNNIAAKVFDRAYYDSLDEEGKTALLKCLQSGIQNADSGMGCYANQPADYDRFKPFFSKALAEYHGVAEDAKHVSDWTLPEGVTYDVETLGLGPLSMRTRVGRNLADFPLPGSMTQADRCAMENKMAEAFEVLIGMGEYGGQYYSITPGHPNFINEEKYQELVKAHIMFKDMAADSYLTSAGIAGDWPHGRGCYVSEDKGFIIWVGEEDHLRIMCMAKSTKIESVFNRLKVALDVVSGIPGLSFAFSEDYGNVTSCPTNLGTGMRSSVHIALPNLTQDGTDAKAKAICKPLGLSVRGLGGEHTPIGSDGTVDISPSARFCIKECDIVKRLYEGLKLLVEAESDIGGEETGCKRASLRAGIRSMFSRKSRMSTTLGKLGEGAEDDLATLEALKSSHPNNIAAKVFDRAYYDSLDEAGKAALLKCLQSGIQNADSGMGCYANQPADYDRFKPFFSKALAEYHGVAEDAKHVSDWTLSDGVSYDVGTLGLRPLSMRTRVGRNLADFPLPGSMTQADRCAMENKMAEAFEVLIGMGEYGGQYYSITPGHPNFINEQKYQELVKAHIMFKDMAADSYLTSAGIAGDWPHGRGCYVSEDKGFIIWVGEEDHLRIMCMAKSTKIESVFNRLKVALDVVSGIPGLSFAFSEDYGNVTSCPTNLGTGMRSSVHIALPNLTQDGTDAKAKAICKPLGLSVRGLGGEHTPIGSDGTVDISPSARFCIKECDIVKRLYEGLKLLVEAECELGPSPAERAVESDLATLDALKSSHPNNIAAKVFDRAYYDSLDEEGKTALLKCLQSGIQNADSGMGCYANQPADYDRFKPFFSKALVEYHGVAEDAKHVSDWTLPEGVTYDVETLGLGPLSMRTRVGRNLADFPLPGSMTQADRCAMENKMAEAFNVLIGMSEYGGQYYSITPGHPNFINEQKYQELVKAHIMFKDMAADSYLTSAGIAGDWPHGRGCYVSEDKGFIIWVGEEDHLRIMCMAKSTKIESVFNRLKVALDVVSGIPGLAFAFSEDYGNVTSCPTNLGTGMRSSVHIALPNLTQDGTDAKAKAICKPLGLSVRGLGGEHTPIGSDGTVDISPSARFCIKECDIVKRLYEGLKLLVEAETSTAKPQPRRRYTGLRKFPKRSVSSLTDGAQIILGSMSQLEALKVSHPNNIAAKVFDRAYFFSLDSEAKAGLLKCLQSGLHNPDSGMGCYANQPADYDRFKPFFSKALAEYHGVAEDAKHVSDWTLPEGVTYDVETLGLGPLSMRTRVGRNLADFPLPGSMTKVQRCMLENKMCEAFNVLIGMKEYGGQYYSITPGHANFIDEEKYQELVKAHIMFKDMAADSYLSAAGIASDWPFGRGCYVSEDKGFIIWVGEEDHLRIMCMAKSTKIESVFNRLKVALDVVSGIPGLAFAFSEDYGNVTSCPTNLGTGMRSSVHIALPNLTQDGTDAKAKAICKPLGLSVRGLGGEHTPIGSDGTVDISPSARFCIKECDIVKRLYEGLKLLVEAEAETPQPSGAGLISGIRSMFSRASGSSKTLKVHLGGVEGDLETLQDLKSSHPNNIAAKVFDRAYYDSLDEEGKAALLKCLQSGIQNADSGMGCYANQPADYDRFKPFFSKALAEYHGVAEDAKHVSDWTLPEGVTYDVETLGLGPLSMRTRVGRNLADFPLPGSMTQADRCAMENKMSEAFSVLIGMSEYGGQYYSITPGHPNFIDEEKYQELVKAHIMFKDMAADSYLTSAGIAGDWPHGRGCYVSEDKGFIIWVGEEDHLRIMCMAKSTKIESVFNRLKVALDVVSGIPGLAFAFSEDYGNVTSCPTNLGTGMRSSVHIALPNLTQDGTDAKAKAICKPLGLSVRGLGGEHTPIGSDGTVDISPSARFCIKECDIVKRLYEGLKLLVEAEVEAAVGGSKRQKRVSGLRAMFSWKSGSRKSGSSQAVRTKKQEGKGADDINTLLALKTSHPNNIAAKVFDRAYYDSLDEEDKAALLKCLQSGIQNADSGMGCYANQPADYDRFKPFFSKALAEYHGVAEDAKHVSDWTLPEGVSYDVETLGLGPLSMRTRVGRNLADFPLPGSMTQADRCAMENKMSEAFNVLIGMSEYGGQYYSITPGHPNFINEEKYQELVKAHIMFKDMAADSYLTSAGIAGDWPHGRGCYVSEDKGFIIWVGEEDHLRIMCMAKSTKIESVFNRLKVALDVVSGIPGLAFAFSEDYGNVTSCPTNLGTGMRSSVHIALPNLTQDGTDAKAKAICKPLGLSVRGLGGEHTPIGSDGTVDISPSARFCIKECDIVKRLYEGLKLLVEAEGELGPSQTEATFDADLATLEALKTSHPNNIAAKVFDRAYYDSLDEEGKAALLKCLQSGIQNADSGMGCYANQPADYDRFKPFFSKALAEYHGVAEDAKHVSDWTLPEGVTYDVETLGLGPLSMRTRVGRNLADFPLPGSMTQADRCAMENKMSEAFNVLIGMSEYGGQYYSITPGHPNFINEEKYQELVKAHIMFKDMAADSYLTSAGIAGDWPHGRGCYVSEDKGFIIWVGEEDHLRIMCMAKSTKIESVFNRLKVALDVVSGIPGLAFAFSEDYGNVTSCPTNLGTGMRSSVHIALPNLTQDGTDAKAKAICKPLGLSVRGLGGEHTPIGSDGTVDISPSARFCIKECDIVKRLYEGLTLLVEAESASGPARVE